MVYRALSPVLMGLAAVGLAAVARADHKDHGLSGYVVKVEGGKLIMAGKDKKGHSHDLAKDVTVLIDGKKARLEDLKPHAHVVAMMDDKHTVLKIAAHTHDEK